SAILDSVPAAGERRRSTMKVDIWTHILSSSYVRHLEDRGQQGPGAFLLQQRALYDIDMRRSVIEAHPGYRQILAPVPAPHIDPGLAGARLVELVRRNNEEVAELVERYPDLFAGWIAATPLADPDAATEEAVRGVRELGALGVQLEEDAINLPLHEDRYEPLFAAMEQFGAGVWLHPFRTPATPGSPPDAAPFLLWQVVGWTFDTTITACRLMFAGVYDRHPDLKLIAHHGGGLIPHLAGRFDLIPHGGKLDPSGRLQEQLQRLQKPPSEYLKMLYVDTAMFGNEHAVRCVVEFFGPDRVMFGSDAPFDTKGGSYFIPRTVSDVEAAVADQTERAMIFHDNAQRILGLNSGNGKTTSQTP
ncbi:MAG TPA: amidohydrolase family protein, partial [Solirubrobacteraceae bacterium]|nr:amidohydrolase family protein [Solirubrobacteraceae bacterium]